MTAIETARQTLLILVPELILLATATAMMTAAPFLARPRRVWSTISVLALVASGLALFLLRRSDTDPLAAVATNDALSGYARMFFILTGLIVFALAHDQVDDARAPEFFGALLMVHAGAMLVAASNEMVFLFVGLELVSIPTYLLLYLSRRTEATQEAATKYFFLSIFSSGLLLYGLAFLYGLLGVSHLKALGSLMYLPGVPQPQFALVAIVFILAGLGFRVAAVPFHFYAPDVYQGSPAIVAAMLAWIPKGVGFLAMIRVLTTVLSPVGADKPLIGDAINLCWIVAAATMILGNAVALGQENLKRLLAYSSIAHAGYLMIGVAVAFHNGPDSGSAYLGAEGILFYLFAYALMTLGVFGGIIALNTAGYKAVDVKDLAGLGRTQPALALAMAICLFSLAGIPPLAGFAGKFQIFASAFSAGPLTDTWHLQSLALLAVINSAAGAYYYLRVVVAMYLKPPPDGLSATPRLSFPWPTAAAIGACASLSLLLGLYPRPIGAAARESAVASAIPPRPGTQARPEAGKPAVALGGPPRQVDATSKP